jgi:hypothetical protein
MKPMATKIEQNTDDWANGWSTAYPLRDRLADMAKVAAGMIVMMAVAYSAACFLVWGGV